VQCLVNEIVNMNKKIFLTFLLLLQTAPALARTYDLEIKKQDVFITGKAVKAITVNGQIPAPTLNFEEGEDAIINVKNSMDEMTSIHWHGILLPAAMDGVPGLNGFHGIAPGETFTYKFKIRQSGTYWYHSHSNMQEQQGLYGSIVIQPKQADSYKADREYVVVLSDFTEENPQTILNNLKINSGYYNYHKRTFFTFLHDIKSKGFAESWRDYRDWNEMRMDPTDLSDVTKYHFLVNGKMNYAPSSSRNLSASQRNATTSSLNREEESSLSNYFLFKKGERVKLRFINASAMTIYDVEIPGLKMKVIEADGQPVKPVSIDEFRFGNAETYDVIVEPQENKAYTISAQSIDRTGSAIATLAPKMGMSGAIPPMRQRTLLTMGDMSMEDMNMKDMDMENMHSGWADRGTPQDHKALEYSDLIALNPQQDLREPTREIELHLDGNMNRYIWTINGKQFPKPIHLKYGERVRLKFINDTMMAHPIHLHGMFMELENYPPSSSRNFSDTQRNATTSSLNREDDLTHNEQMKWLPNKHTIIIPPAQTVSAILTANEAGEWAFHCHLLYHMESGMMTSITVEKTSE